MSSGQKILLYIVSFIIPIVGIILGIVWMNAKGEPEKNSVGKTCLILGIIAFVLSCICSIVFGGLGALLGAGS